MNNAHIAATLERLADLLEFQGANPFRIRAYRTGARAIRDLAPSVEQLVREQPAALEQIEGIGKSVAEKCVTLVTTGSLPQLDQLLETIPESVLTLLTIPGLGPKKAALLYQELGISTLDQLRKACEAQRIRGLKGFGAKTEQAILAGLPLAQAAGERIYWAEAEQIVLALRAHLQACPAVEQLEFAGSFRRGKETVGDLDALVVSADPPPVMDQLADFPDVAQVLLRGDTKMSVRLSSQLQVDLRVVPRASFGAAWQYFTGSKEHNVELRGRAKQRGLKINEYGIYRVAEDQDEFLGGATEEEVYTLLGLPVFPPELREARHEFHWADRGPLPELVTLEDIRGDLHMHTNATDGLASLEDMVQAAAMRGYEYVAITDHSQRVTMAHGLNPARLLQQWAAIDALNRSRSAPPLVLKGIEVDILEKGGLDLPDEVLAQADWVVASVHYGQRQSRQQITDRIIQALAHPSVSAIAHPTGRLINRRPPYDVDVDAILQAAREYGKLMELNANPARLDLNDVHCAAAKDLGVPVVISTDAHHEEGLDVMRYGLLQARRGGLTRLDVANTRRWNDLRAMIGRS